MAIRKCINGHHYDDRKFDKCPLCKDISSLLDFMDYDETVALPHLEIDDYDETVDFHIESGNNEDEEKTVGLFSFETGSQLVVGWIVCIGGPARGKDYRLYHGWNRIGRNISMDIYIPEDKKISRDSHAGIVYDEKSSKFHLVNQNGALTYLNGKLLIDTSEIISGDKITMGDSDFIFIAFCTEERRWEEE